MAGLPADTTPPNISLKEKDSLLAVFFFAYLYLLFDPFKAVDLNNGDKALQNLVGL